jgi:hypothetical protein
MKPKQQEQVNRIQNARPDATFAVAEGDGKVYLNAEDFPTITIGKNAGIQVDLPSYGDPFEAAIHGDELLANKKTRDARTVDEGCGVDKESVGSIAERIVANELERRGFHVTILKTGTPNADLKAERDGRVWYIQVKGASQLKTRSGWEDWWVG